MTVSTAYSVLEFAGNDATTAFAVTWPFFDSTLVVSIVDGDGIETTKTITTHYTVSGGTDSDGLPATGTVTMLTAPATGETLKVARSTPKTQGSTWSENDAFPQATVEAGLDKLTLISQEEEGVEHLALVTAGATDYWDAESKVIRNLADPSDDTDAVSYGYLQTYSIEQGTATGDVLGQSSSVDGEIALFSGTTGKAIKRASTTGLLKATAGVLSAAVADTDYLLTSPVASTSSVLKGDGAGAAVAAAATDLGAGKHTIWIPAGAMTARTTSGAAVGTTELASNYVMLSTLDFDTTSAEAAQFMIRMPKSWNEGTVTFVPVWTAASGSGGVVWALSGVAVSNDDPFDVDPRANTQTSTDTFILANDCHIGPESSAITIAGSPAEGDVVVFEVNRIVGDASDTLAVDAKLIGIHVYITTDALTDD